MNGDILILYTKILKHGWKVDSCESLGNGYYSVCIYDPQSTKEERQYWIKTNNTLGTLLRPPNYVCSYLLRPR